MRHQPHLHHQDHQQCDAVRCRRVDVQSGLGPGLVGGPHNNHASDHGHGGAKLGELLCLQGGKHPQHHSLNI